MYSAAPVDWAMFWMCLLQTCRLGLENKPIASLRRGKTSPPRMCVLDLTQPFDGDAPIASLQRPPRSNMGSRYNAKPSNGDAPVLEIYKNVE